MASARRFLRGGCAVVPNPKMAGPEHAEITPDRNLHTINTVTNQYSLLVCEMASRIS
jgi:hypothetical protein